MVRANRLPVVVLLVSGLMVVPGLMAGPLEGPEWCDQAVVVHECTEWQVGVPGNVISPTWDAPTQILDRRTGHQPMLYLLRHDGGLVIDAIDIADGTVADSRVLATEERTAGLHDAGEMLLVQVDAHVDTLLGVRKDGLSIIWAHEIDGGGSGRVAVSPDGSRFAVSAPKVAIPNVVGHFAEHEMATGDLIWSDGSAAFVLEYSANGTLHRASFDDLSVMVEGLVPGSPERLLAHRLEPPQGSRCRGAFSLTAGPEGHMYVGGMDCHGSRLETYGFVAALQHGQVNWYQPLPQDLVPMRMEVSPDGAFLAAGASPSNDDRVVVLETGSGGTALDLASDSGLAAFSPDSGTIYVVREEILSDHLDAYDLATGHGIFGTGISFPPRIFATGLDADTGHVYMAANAFVPAHMSVDGDEGVLVAFATTGPDGSLPLP